MVPVVPVVMVLQQILMELQKLLLVVVEEVFIHLVVVVQQAQVVPVVVVLEVFLDPILINKVEQEQLALVAAVAAAVEMEELPVVLVELV